MPAATVPTSPAASSRRLCPICAPARSRCGPPPRRPAPRPALTDDELVLAARIAVQPGDRAEALALLDEIVAWRRQNQPGGQNCGSVFVNPIPGAVTAGQLVDQLGLRGHQVGTAFVSPKHANFIQGTDGGRAATCADRHRASRSPRRRGIELRSGPPGRLRHAIGAGAGLDGRGA